MLQTFANSEIVQVGKKVCEKGKEVTQKKSKPIVWWDMKSWRMQHQGHTQSKKIDIPKKAISENW